MYYTSVLGTTQFIERLAQGVEIAATVHMDIRQNLPAGRSHTETNSGSECSREGQLHNNNNEF